MTTPLRPWQNKQQQTAQPSTDTQEPIEFLEQLRPGGPWVLTAIVPDGITETITAFNHEQVIAFVRKHDGKRNLYFSINPTRTSMTHKAAKTDIAAAEYLYADLDPRADETPDIAKERYLSSLITHQPPPTVIIDSGNGLQCLWRLAEPVAIPNSVIVTDGKKTYKEDAQKLVEDLERRTEALMVRLGTAAGTQNIDRIFRLPGTTNLPNKKKLSLHRVACPTKLLRFNANIYTLEEFPRPILAEERYPESQRQDDNGLTVEQIFKKLPAALRKLIASSSYEGEDRNETAASVISQLQTQGLLDTQIHQLFKAYPKGIGERYAEGKDLKADIERLRKKFQPQSKNKSAFIICVEDIPMRSKDWLWEGHLLRGAQELLTGIPGLGKSQVQIGLIACVTAGLPWPDGAKPSEPSNVILLTAEDTVAQDVKPRLIAAGADIKRVFILNYIRNEGKNRQFLLSEDLEQLEKSVYEIGDIGLIAIDPITAYMGGKVDSHKATEVRSQLSPLKDFAERTNIAISTITHPPKSANGKAIDHFIGSQAFIAAGRIGHVCATKMVEDEDGGMTASDLVYFTMAKTNVHRKMPTLAYRQEVIHIGIDPANGRPIEAPRVAWEQQTYDITADEAVAEQGGLSKSEKKEQTQNRLQNLLLEVMRDKVLPYNDVLAEVIKEGFTVDQLNRAKRKLNIVSERRNDQWEWRLQTFDILGK